MIAMAPAIMKIISMTSLTRMNLMVQNTQIAKKKAVSYRSKYQHEPLSRLIENDFLLLNRATGHYSYLKQQELLDHKEILDPKFS